MRKRPAPIEKYKRGSHCTAIASRYFTGEWSPIFFLKFSYKLRSLVGVTQRKFTPKQNDGLYNLNVLVYYPTITLIQGSCEHEPSNK